jgi:L-ascorbate metabolism protein UlaG (beta-lactamase superfamily)
VGVLAVSVKWLAHSSFQITAEGRVIYVDLEEYGEASEKANVILVTHSHTDHCDPEKIDKLRKDDTVIIAPADCASKIRAKVRTLKPGEVATVGNVRVKAVHAYNTKRFRSPGIPFHPKGYGVGYLITVGGKTVYHAGDTDFIPEMKELGPVDMALLPSGDTYTMNNAEAAVAINPKIAVPIHRLSTNPEEFRKRVEGRSKVRVSILQEGEEVILK